MSKLSRDEVFKLAALSRLRLTDEEAEQLQTELSDIISYVEILDTADTEGLEPTYQISGLKNVYRRDEVIDYGYRPKDLLKNAPDTQDSQFKVSRVL